MEVNTLDDFLELVKKNFSNKTEISDRESAPYYLVGQKLGFPKELLQFYFESLISSRDYNQIVSEKYESQVEVEVDEIINNQSHLNTADIDDIKSSANKKETKKDHLFINEAVPQKSNFLDVIWNKMYRKFASSNVSFNIVLQNTFNLSSNDSVPFYNVYELFKSNKDRLDLIVSSPNRVGISKVVELKKLLSSVIQESVIFDSYVKQHNIDKNIVDFLFNIDEVNEKNINFLIDYNSKPISSELPYPIFWLFNLYLKAYAKNNENHYFIYRSILSNKDYSDESIASLCKLHRNRVQQIRSTFLNELGSVLDEFKNKLSNFNSIENIKNLMTSYLDYEKQILDWQKHQNVTYRISFCNVLLGCFSENLVATGEYNDLFVFKYKWGKITKAIHLLGKEENVRYVNLINKLIELSEDNSIRTVYKTNINELIYVKSQYLKDIIDFELKNWSFRNENQSYINAQIEVDYTTNCISRVDIRNIGNIELDEITDFVNVRNKFNTIYNNELNNAFSENNEFGYTSRYNEAFKRHLYDLGFHSIANKWVRKEYILQFVSQDIFEYRKCNFRDLIIELIRFNEQKYNGKNTTFWLNELNQILEHNYAGTNNISAILRDKRVNVQNGLIYLKN